MYSNIIVVAFFSLFLDQIISYHTCLNLVIIDPNFKDLERCYDLLSYIFPINNLTFEPKLDFPQTDFSY